MFAAYRQRAFGFFNESVNKSGQIVVFVGIKDVNCRKAPDTQDLSRVGNILIKLSVR